MKFKWYLISNHKKDFLKYVLPVVLDWLNENFIENLFMQSQTLLIFTRPLALHNLVCCFSLVLYLRVCEHAISCKCCEIVKWKSLKMNKKMLSKNIRTQFSSFEFSNISKEEFSLEPIYTNLCLQHSEMFWSYISIQIN